jgi:dTDP-4-amino-4,6-dideoxygalactose transaminase
MGLDDNKIKIPFSRNPVYLKYLDLYNIESLIESGMVVSGMFTEDLEEYFKETFNVKHAIACSNCTSGLIIALKAIDAKDKKVALECNNCIPVWCDVDPKSWLLTNETIKESDIVVAVDTFGNQANIETDKPVVYDSAHGFGLSKLGHRGIVEVVSFAMTKAVTAMQGGIILTNDDKIASTAKFLVSFSAKMGEVNALVAMKSIEQLACKLKVRDLIIKEYRTSVKVPFEEQVITEETNYSVYSILLENNKIRDKIVELFGINGIEVKTYYTPLVEGQKNTDDVYSRIISLPIYPKVKSHVGFICDVINEVLR